LVISIDIATNKMRGTDLLFHLEFSKKIILMIFHFTFPMEGEKSFDELKLQPKLLRGILEYGFEKPSFVQTKVIPSFVEGKDIIVSVQSGTGKTASFAISILQSIDFDKKEPQAIILVPSRELAQGLTIVTGFTSSEISLNLPACKDYRSLLGTYMYLSY
jgi:hypothetical protein